VENNLLCLEESGDQLWARDSQDGNGGVTHFGVELIGIYSLFDMVICNGMRGWPASRGITCKNYNGQSLVDYLICSQSFTSRVLKFDIGDCPIEMKSDHVPLLVKLNFPASPHNNQIIGIRKKNISKGKILINQENRERFSATLKQQFQVIKYSKTYITSNETSGHVHSSLLILTIHKDLSACKRSNPKKRATVDVLGSCGRYSPPRDLL
jgi:hypothetical protein